MDGDWDRRRGGEGRRESTKRDRLGEGYALQKGERMSL